MILRVQAEDEEGARRVARTRLREQGLDPESEHLIVRGPARSRGALQRLFRRRHEFVVEVEREALADLSPVHIHRLARSLDADYPGQATVRVADEGILLRVLPPVGRSRRHVTVADVSRLLAEKEIQDVDEEAVAEAVRAAAGDWVAVAPRRPELDRDAEIHVAVADDGMTATITLKRPLGGRRATQEQLAAALAEAGVRFGIDSAAVARLAQHPMYDEPVVVARGREPQPGRDGRLELDLPEFSRRPALREDGTVDYREIVVMHSVTAGERVGQILAPEPGVDGQKVTGDVIEAPAGKAVRVRLGKGVSLDEETGIITATREGMVIQADGVDVAPVYQVTGDVDFSVGNIRFPGMVHIGGDVLEGFRVEAEGSIVIGGSVVGSEVISYNGDIEVRQGIRGPGQSIVEAPTGRVRARFVENARVIARTVEVTDAILHSQVRAEESIVVTQREGRIAGGRLEAGTLVESAFIGSVHATRTEISIRGRVETGQKTVSGGVRVRQMCHPGTTIEIAGARLAVREELSRVRFRLDEGTVHTEVF